MTATRVDCLRVAMVAGEASGDLLGARVIAALKTRCDQLVVEGIGGPQMVAAGMDSLYPMERLSVMGLVDPLRRLPQLLRMRRQLYRHWRRNPPDVFLGIDAPDFNLGLAQRLHRVGVRTAHLVSPSVWAWRQGRIRRIAQAVDTMLCLFPFETEIYVRHGIEHRCVGHPLADEIPAVVDKQGARRALGMAGAGKLLALLPGSRSAEIRALAPVFLEVADRLWRQDQAISFILPTVNSAREAELRAYLEDYPELPLQLVQGHSREALAAADAVLLASGTATLEAALLQRPMVVAYRMGAVSWAVMSRLVQTQYIALPNLLSGRALVPEFLQQAVTPAALHAALQPLLNEETTVSRLQPEFATLRRQLRLNCAESVAEVLLDLARPVGGNA